MPAKQRPNKINKNTEVSEPKSKKTSKGNEPITFEKLGNKVRYGINTLVAICLVGFLLNKGYNVYEKNTLKPLGGLVQVDRGHHLNYYCQGQENSKYTVVFLEDAGDSFLQSYKLIQEISKKVRICSYDRVGRGFSDSPVGTVNANNTLNDLESFINKIVGNKPVVLLGHSFGSLVSTAYALKNPSNVAGLLLFNPIGTSFYDLGGEEVYNNLKFSMSFAEVASITGIMRFIELFELTKGWGYEFYPEVKSLLSYNLNQQRVHSIAVHEIDSVQRNFVELVKNQTETVSEIAAPVQIIFTESYSSHVSAEANQAWSKATQNDKFLRGLSKNLKVEVIKGELNDYPIIKSTEATNHVLKFIETL